MPPAPDTTVYGALPDRRGRIWVYTNDGVQRLTPRADGTLEEQVFRRADGVIHDECNTDSQWVDAQDRFWVGTLAGLSVYDPRVGDESVRRPRHPKPLRLTEFRLDGAPHTRDGGWPPRFSSGVREIQFEYALLSGFRESESRYRSRLAGFEDLPTGWMRERRRVFKGLPPGQFLLTVEAQDGTGQAAQPLRPAFSMAPQWWQRQSVRAFGFLLGVAAI